MGFLTHLKALRADPRSGHDDDFRPSPRRRDAVGMAAGEHKNGCHGMRGAAVAGAVHGFGKAGPDEPEGTPMPPGATSGIATAVAAKKAKRPKTAWREMAMAKAASRDSLRRR